MKRPLYIAILTLVLVFCSYSQVLAAVNKAVGDMPTSGTWGTAGEVTNITGTGTITLTGNVTVVGPIAIASSANVTITKAADTASRVISIGSAFEPVTTGTVQENSMFRVRSGGKLTIKGTGNGDGRIYLSGGATWSDTVPSNEDVEDDDSYYMTANTCKPASGCRVLGHGLINSYGTLNLQYINLRDVYNTSTSYGGAITIQNNASNGTTTLDHVHIYRCVAALGAGIFMQGSDTSLNADQVKVTVNNSTVRLCRTTDAEGGGAIRSRGKADGSLYMTNTQVFANYSSYHGGGIYWNATDGADGKTKLSLNKCQIYRNTANGKGGGMFIEASVEFVTNTTTVEKNKCTTRGGGICLNDYNGATTLSDAVSCVYNINNYVSIRDNQATTDGGGLAVTLDGTHTLPVGSTFTININGATITGNKATRHGGGVYVIYDPTNTSDYSYTASTKLGSCNISNNTASYDGGGVYMTKVSIGSAGGTTTISGNKALDGRGGGVYLTGGGSFTQENLSITNNSSTNLTNRDNVYYHGGGVYLVDGSITVTGTPTITGNSTSATSSSGSARGGGFYVNNGNVTFSSTTATATISGNSAGGHGGGFFVKNGNVNLQKVDIKNNTSEQYGGGFGVSGNGTLGKVVINGVATIDNNKATVSGKSGGGLYIDTGTLDFKNSATITNNTAASNGGGIYASNSHVTFSGETTMTSNAATSGSGGGVYATGGNVTISSTASLTSNTAGTSGGGVYAASGDVTIADATFTKNTAKNGGGVYTLGDGTLGDVIITNATFDQNQATSGNGGGAVVNTGNLKILNQATFTNNTATEFGGGIYTIGDETNGNVTIATATISNNSSKSGGGVYVNNGNINITTKATITGNRATTTSGGGVYAIGNIDIADAKIDSNTAVISGGGIFLSGGELTIAKGDVSNNSAGTYGGGLHAESNTAKNITLAGDGEFKNNTATLCGGGISVSGPITLNTSGTIDSNSAKNGGGIYLTNGATMNFQEGIIRYNRATGTTGSAFTTAYQKTASALYGVGGGVFVEENSSLLFDISSTTLGLYGNTAEIAADDIFANGNGTTVEIPQVDAMSLADFDMPTTRLFWAEDYLAGDTGYANGTKIINGWDGMSESDKKTSIIRYRAAQAILAVRELIFSGSSLTLPRAVGDSYPPGVGNYVCLSLGYNNMSITITKNGLQAGESAIFTYTRSGDSSPMGRIVLTGVDGVTPVSKKIVLSEGTWIIAEVGWTYTYTNATPSIERTLTASSTDEDRVFTFTNVKRNNAPPHHESGVVNTMK